MTWVTRAFELIGVVVLGVGPVIAVVRFLQRLAAHVDDAYPGLRTDLARAILLGLEFLIVADIVRTIAVATTVENAVTLGIIVLVRTFLSFSLEIELEGVVPWKARELGARAQSGPPT